MGWWDDGMIWCSYRRYNRYLCKRFSWLMHIYRVCPGQFFFSTACIGSSLVCNGPSTEFFLSSTEFVGRWNYRTRRWKTRRRNSYSRTKRWNIRWRNDGTCRRRWNVRTRPFNYRTRRVAVRMLSVAPAIRKNGVFLGRWANMRMRGTSLDESRALGVTTCILLTAVSGGIASYNG